MIPSRQLSKLSILVIAAGAWVSLPLTGLFAGDGSRLQPMPESQPVPHSHHCPSCQHGQGHGHHHGHVHQQYVQGAPAGHYHGGSVQGHCPSCQQNNRVWGHGQRRLSPGTGWAAPGKVPVVRERVQYQQYYPHYWSGNGPGPAPAVPYRPMVYTPTDTTQLGFYYQHAPSWTAQPWRVPGPPHPAYWHNRACGGFRQPAHHAHQGSYYQQISNGTEISAPVQGTQITPQPHEIQAPQTILIPPTPDFRPKTPIMSALPDAPPEV